MKDNLVLNLVRGETISNFILTTKGYLDFLNKVDWNGGYETPAGIRVQGRPRRRKCAEEAPGPPAESECLEWKSLHIPSFGNPLPFRTLPAKPHQSKHLQRLG